MFLTHFSFVLNVFTFLRQENQLYSILNLSMYVMFMSSYCILSQNFAPQVLITCRQETWFFELEPYFHKQGKRMGIFSAIKSFIQTRISCQPLPSFGAWAWTLSSHQVHISLIAIDISLLARTTTSPTWIWWMSNLLTSCLFLLVHYNHCGWENWCSMPHWTLKFTRIWTSFLIPRMLPTSRM